MGFQKGPFAATITKQRFKIVKKDDKELPIFEIDFAVRGRIDKTTGNVIPDASVTDGTFGMFMTADQLNNSKEFWDDGRPKDKTIDFLRHLEVVGNVTRFSQLDPDTPGFFDLAGREIRVYGKPQGDNDQFIRWNLMISTSKPKVNEKGVASKLDSILKGALGKADALTPKAERQKAEPVSQRAQPQTTAEDRAGLDDDEIPF